MHARDPQEVDRLFAQALNAADLEALVALYEPHAAQEDLAPDELDVDDPDYPLIVTLRAAA